MQLFAELPDDCARDVLEYFENVDDACGGSTCHNACAWVRAIIVAEVAVSNALRAFVLFLYSHFLHRPLPQEDATFELRDVLEKNDLDAVQDCLRRGAYVDVETLTLVCREATHETLLHHTLDCLRSTWISQSLLHFAPYQIKAPQLHKHCLVDVAVWPLGLYLNMCCISAPHITTPLSFLLMLVALSSVRLNVSLFRLVLCHDRLDQSSP